jgi:P-type Cu2+ transporter
MEHDYLKKHKHCTDCHQSEDQSGKFFVRFLVVSALLLPLLAFSNIGIAFLSIPDFTARQYLLFLITSVIFYFSFIFFQHAVHEVKSRRFGMMTLVSVALVSGYLFSAAATFLPLLRQEFYLEIGTLIWVLLFGHFLEAKSFQSAGNALKEVAKLLPSKVHLLENGETKDVSPSVLKKGDIILIKPGEKVAVDGVILTGRANLNESLVTGESKPVKKRKNDKVIAGSICQDGSLQVKVEKSGKDSTVGQIKSLVLQAQASKPKSQRLADKAAGWLTFIALGTALLTLAVWFLLVGQSLAFSLTLAITVLVISCPHALGLAIPAVSTIATSLALKNGLFIKDLAKLEQVKDIEYVVLDKTGTLTKGEFGVTDVVLQKENRDKVLQLAGSLEKNSSHLLAKAILKKVRKEGIKFLQVKNFKDLAGKGVTGTIKGKKYYLGSKSLVREKNLENKLPGEVSDLALQAKTLVFLFSEDKVLGVLALQDLIKEEAKKAVENLHKFDLKIVMLTGDTVKTAKFIADQLNIDKFFASVLPKDKFKYIKKLQNKGKKVMMVGDGVNDAPALTQADVGVAIGAGTDIAVEAGNIVLVSSNPYDISKLILLSRKVNRKMKENLLWATGYNVLAIPAAAGVLAPFNLFLSPELGAFLMSLSTVIVVVNALSLRNINLSP